MKQKETPKSPMSGGKGAEVSKTLFYICLGDLMKLRRER